MTTIGEVRLYKVGNIGRLLLFQSRQANCDRGGLLLHMPVYTVPDGTEFIDILVLVPGAGDKAEDHDDSRIE